MKLTMTAGDRANMERKQFKEARSAQSKVLRNAGRTLEDAARALENQVIRFFFELEEARWRKSAKFKDITQALATLDKQTGTRHCVPVLTLGLDTDHCLDHGYRRLYLAADGFRFRFYDHWNNAWKDATPFQAASDASLRLRVAEHDLSMLSRDNVERRLTALPNVLEPEICLELSVADKIGRGIRMGVLCTILSPITAGVAIHSARARHKRWLQLAHQQRK